MNKTSLRNQYSRAFQAAVVPEGEQRVAMGFPVAAAAAGNRLTAAGDAVRP